MPFEEDDSVTQELTVDQFLGVVEDDVWGPWMLDRTTQTLYIEDPCDYYIPLRELVNSAKLLDWIFQVESKTWATPELLGYLLKALSTIMQPQRHICSGGDDQTINVENYLKTVLK